MNRSIIAMAAVAAIAGAALTADAPALAASCVTPGVVAHRGGTEHYTEDTRNAFLDSTANIGARFWENDVQFTSDNVPVIMHDDTVDRTTNGTGNVADLTYAQIAQLRTADDQPVPTLRDFINDQSVMHVYAFVEIKGTPTESQWAAFVAAVKSREGKGGPRPVISSFDPDVLDQVAVRLPGYTRALIQSAGDANPADVTPHATILLKHHDSITATRLAKWTAAGLRVYAWADIAADPQSEWERIAGYSTDTVAGSVSGYITATPGAYLAWRNARTC
jgi:glycerophosphoryl diester phosphodiesterase